MGKSRSIRQFQFVREDESTLLLRYELHDLDEVAEQSVLRGLRDALPGITVSEERTGQLPRTATGKVKRYIDIKKAPLN